MDPTWCLNYIQARLRCLFLDAKVFFQYFDALHKDLSIVYGAHKRLVKLIHHLAKMHTFVGKGPRDFAEGADTVPHSRLIGIGTF